MRLKPFVAWRPDPDVVSRVASPPYDVVDTPTARRIAEGNPHSFLHVVRPEIDLPPETHPYDDSVYETGLRNLEAMMRDGVLRQDDAPALYLYRQVIDDHAQVGVVALCHAEDYEADVIRKHEKTLKAKEDDRTRHIDTLSAHTGPVFLTYRDDPHIDAVVEAAMKSEPLYDFTAPDGVRHTVWRSAESQPLVDAFRSIPLSYVADGHHRAASAARVARLRRERDPAPTGDRDDEWFLSVLFPAKQLHILPYNRLVLDLNGMAVSAFLDAVGEVFEIGGNADGHPRTPGEIGLFVGNAWHRLHWDAASVEDPVEALDVSRLQEKVLGPILGIHDVRTSDRIEFVGGIYGTKVLEARVRAGAGAAFSMVPVSVDQLMAIADAGRIMPPKSTWFEPKLRSGLFVHRF